jgi:hypothetical protein
LAPTMARRNNLAMTALERRRKRSTDPLVALHYQLAHARNEDRLEAVVLADGSGLVVAGAGPWALCEELAAYAPLLAQGIWTEPGRETSRVEEFCREVDVQAVDIEGQRVLLCARGAGAGKAGNADNTGARTEAMRRAAEGIARILKPAA